MKIYFAGAIRGGREDQKLYYTLIDYIGTKAEVLTEHVGLDTLSMVGENNLSDHEIFKRDVNWLKSAQGVIAEVTAPSLGVGYELGIAESMHKPVLCLFRNVNNMRLSAMLQGNEKFFCKNYSSLKEAKNYIDAFLAKVSL
ncbi:MAG: nucleoside 2-deoxyribosyltransferase [Candidatus Marinimicrobia bacterium]|jgi:nucleoside 2-deoxyribosyltransferase|nr:nucleoside 2-deoxyribosyltransferase [Candidatus Neomarinimicrobiota bacterium]